MATPEQVKAFIDAYTPFAKDTANQLGGTVSPGELLGQWGLERGWEFPTAAGGLNNLAGIEPGSRDNPGGGTFMNYGSIQAFVDDFIVQARRLITNRDGATYFDQLANGAWEGYDKQANVNYANAVKNAADTVKKIAPDLFNTNTDDNGIPLWHKIANAFGYDDAMNMAERETPGNTEAPTENGTSIGDIINKTKDAVTGTADFVSSIPKILQVVVGLVIAVVGIWLIAKQSNTIAIEKEVNVE